MGLGRGFVSLWERGLRLPSIPRLFKMARKLETMPEALYFDFYSAYPQEPANARSA